MLNAAVFTLLTTDMLFYYNQVALESSISIKIVINHYCTVSIVHSLFSLTRRALYNVTYSLSVAAQQLISWIKLLCCLVI